MATHGLSCTAWRQRPTLRRRALRVAAWTVFAWCVVGWLLVIPAWLYLRGAA